MTSKNPSSASTAKPVVLMIDDNDDEADAQKELLAGPVSVVTRSPSDVTDADLQNANVVLVDLKLDQWITEPDLPVALRPDDGIALSAVLRSHLSDEGRVARPKAFALNSGKLNNLSPDSPVQAQRHVIARTYNLEWAFSKEEAGPAMASQLASLGSAIQVLVRAADAGATAALDGPQSEELLALPKRVGWRQRALEEVLASRPPTLPDPIASSGVAFLRWLLHDVLPYPSFLLEDRYLAARLRVTVESLRKALSSPAFMEKLDRRVGRLEYRGILADFLGRRWWRAGVEALVWDLTSGRPFDASALHKSVRTLAKTLEPLQIPDPVVIVEYTGQPTDSLIPLAEAVEIIPAGWPAHAEHAWASLEAVRGDDALYAVVAEHERGRLGDPQHPKD